VSDETLQGLQKTLARNWHLAISPFAKLAKAAKARKLAKARKAARAQKAAKAAKAARARKAAKGPVCPSNKPKQTSSDGASKGIPRVCP
jgi:hypothetical protein